MKRLVIFLIISLFSVDFAFAYAVGDSIPLSDGNSYTLGSVIREYNSAAGPDLASFISSNPHFGVLDANSLPCGCLVTNGIAKELHLVVSYVPYSFHIIVYGASIADPCSSKAGTIAGYDVATYAEGSTPNLVNQCNNDCAVSASIHESLGPCINDQCVSSIKYTYTGLPCTDEPQLDLEDKPQDACNTEWIALKNHCGGAAKVASFDWKTCSGTCDEKECGSEWAALASRCGGESNIINWDGKKCTGTCKEDPTPDVGNGDAAPTNIASSNTTNSDGTSTNTTTTTYNIDGTTYTTTTITNYDSDGNVTGSSTSHSQSSGDGAGGSDDGDGEDDGDDDETFNAIGESSAFQEGYNPGEFDISGRFSSFFTNVKSSSLFSFSTSFFESLPGGGTSTYTVDAGMYGSHTIDLSETMSTGLAVLKTILLVVFGFLSIRAVIMKR
ncbi:MAG: hypothetical protein AB7U29_18325 [Desulfobulbus sp.]